MEEKPSHRLRSFTIELVIYSIMVVAYVSLVMGFMGEWLKELYDQGKTRYAITSLALIIGQGVVLEMLTSALLRLIRRRTD